MNRNIFIEINNEKEAESIINFVRDYNPDYMKDFEKRNIDFFEYIKKKDYIVRIAIYDYNTIELHYARRKWYLEYYKEELKEYKNIMSFKGSIKILKELLNN